MNNCPHCQATANPLRLLFVSRWIPYRCGHCGSRSRLPKHQMSVVEMLTVGLCITFTLAAPTDLGFWRLLLCLVALITIFVGGTMLLCFRLEPMDKI